MRNLPVLLLLLSFIGSALASGTGTNDLRRLFRELDNTIARSGEFVARREAQLDSLKGELMREGLSNRVRFGLTVQLARNYSSYQSDSALVYLQRSLVLAEEIGDADLLLRSRSAIGLSYSLGGRFYEAEAVLQGIRDTVSVSREALGEYYTAQHRKNRELRFLSTEPEARRNVFRRHEHYYAVRAAEVSDDLFTRFYYGYMDAIVREDWDSAEMLCDSLLALVPPASHEYAKAANHKALLERRLGHDDEQLAWLVRSAMADIRSAVRDHGSLCAISEELFGRGEIERAMNYIRVAINDTRFFNSPSRSWRDMAILPQIEQAYSERNNRLHTMYVVLILIVLLFFLSAAGGILFVLRQNRRLAIAQQTLRASNEQLDKLARSLNRTNECLNRQNIRIADANRIKEVYIGEFLQTISEYINKLSATYQHVNKMLRDERIAELRRECSRSNVRNDELKEFYTLFDKTFLGLFPTFIDELNALLSEEARTEGRRDGGLSTVLRIYALVRLGITDTVTIAALLHCSIYTVYNYRSFTQRHVLPGIGNFEQQVQQIGLDGIMDTSNQIKQ